MAFPDDVTLEFAKKDRKGRLFLDVLRNGHASHAAAPYSLRAVAEAALAAPLSWEEALAADFHPRMVTIRSIDERLDAGIDPWRDHPAPESTITAAARTLLA
jgi:bifunctional non-homologous end joining protein LigD